MSIHHVMLMENSLLTISLSTMQETITKFITLHLKFREIFLLIFLNKIFVNIFIYYSYNIHKSIEDQRNTI